jgi:hypothetical protein
VFPTEADILDRLRDGLELKEFDYIDIGAILDTSGAVPVVIKSLIFPSTTALGKAGAKPTTG